MNWEFVTANEVKQPQNHADRTIDPAILHSKRHHEIASALALGRRILSPGTALMCVERTQLVAMTGGVTEARPAH